MKDDDIINTEPWLWLKEHSITPDKIKAFREQSELFCKYVFEILDDYYWVHGNHLSNTVRNVLLEHEDQLSELTFGDAIDVLVARDDLFTIKLVKDWCDNKTRLLIIKPKRGAKYAPRKDKQ